MALSRTERRIRRCYYWTNLSWEDCVDKHMPRIAGNQQKSAPSEPALGKYEHLALVALILFGLYIFFIKK